MAKKIGVVLSGCGVYDGAEIHEAVCTLLALDRAGAEYVCLAPNKTFDVVDHRTQKATGEKRNVLTESARIARGQIQDVTEVRAGDLDGVILPGGFGAAKNLCNFATAGAECEVDPGVRKLLCDVHKAGKPVAALCIAPVVLARVFGPDFHPDLTIGNDSGTAAQVVAMGANHVNAPTTGVIVDRKNKLVTTPCYMLAGRVSEVWTGAEGAVAELLKLA
jgi:enhancing lycopene biosynthesis protein 2